jgi:hypothetical protein
MAAITSGIGSPVAVRLQPLGRARDEGPVKRSRSLSSIRCWVPIRVALRRPDRIHRRTVSGSRLDRLAASGTVSIVALYYNKHLDIVQQRRR